jgi:gliding motility-associated-like protein
MINQRFSLRSFSLILTLSSFSLNALQAQNCEGLSLTNGLNGWSFWEGKRSQGGAISSLNPVYPPNPNRISIHSAASGGNIYPVEFCTVNKPWVPPGFTDALRVGNVKVGSQVDRAAYTLLVDSTNALIQMSIFVGLEYKDDHNANVQPKFEIRIMDANGNEVSCGYFKVVAGYIVPGFETQPEDICASGFPIEYLSWKPVSIDLTDYIGQNITFEFTSYDCSHGGHFGFGLVAIKCQEAKITASDFCPSADNSITLSAPEGFSKYTWSNGATTQSITIQNPPLGQTVWVKFTPFSSLSGACESYIEFKIPNGHDIVAQPVALFCEGRSVELTANAPSGSTYTWLPGGQKTASITVSQPGDYTVEAIKNDCPFRDTVSVKQIDLPHHNTQTQNATCAGSANASACITLANSQQPVNFKWSSGQNTACIGAVTAGTYSVTVTEAASSLGCSLTTTVTMTEPPALSSQPKVLQLPYCHDWDEGRAEVTVAGGTPPYQIQWSNGESGQQVDILEEGLYMISISDASGCLLLDSVEMPRLRFELHKKDNPCPKGRDGEISVEIQSGPPPYQYRLLPGDFGTQTVFTGLVSGIYEVEVKVHGCALNDFIEIKDLRDEPFQILPTLLPGDTVETGELLLTELNFNYPPNEIHWEAPSFDTIFHFNNWRMEGLPANSGEIKIFGTDISGCPDTVMARYVVLKVRDVYIPNIFSPNGPFENQFFYVFSKKNQVRMVKTLQVHDRSGSMFYQANDFPPNDPSYGWDGRYKGRELNPGVYIYFAEVEFIDGEIIIYKGDVTLYR